MSGIAAIAGMGSFNFLAGAGQTGQVASAAQASSVQTAGSASAADGPLQLAPTASRQEFSNFVMGSSPQAAEAFSTVMNQGAPLVGFQNMAKQAYAAGSSLGSA